MILEGDRCGGLGGDPAAASGRGCVDQRDRAVDGDLAQHGAGGVGVGSASQVRADAAADVGRWGRGPGAGAAGAVAADAGDRDRAADRHSMTTLKDRVRVIRPEYVGIDPVDRVVYSHGEVTQCDLWFPATRIPVAPGQDRVLPVLVMTLAFSRFLTATMIPSRQAGDILSGMWELISGVGRVTKTLVWDRETAIGGTGRVTAPAAAFAGTLATQ